MKTVDRYRHRRDLLCDGLKSMGIVVDPPKGSVYVWAPVPAGYDSKSFAARLLEQAAVVVTPGTGYGPSGEGFVRFSITIPDDRLEEGVERLRGVVT
jgi:LL-diaminopimelate aminotransferase